MMSTINANDKHNFICNFHVKQKRQFNSTFHFAFSVLFLWMCLYVSRLIVLFCFVYSLDVFYIVAHCWIANWTLSHSISASGLTNSQEMSARLAFILHLITTIVFKCIFICHIENSLYSLAIYSFRFVSINWITESGHWIRINPIRSGHRSEQNTANARTHTQTD